ncbi:MAG: hypothetical protein AB7G75_34980 [Candidatus Binatia bacterium]
MEPQAEKVRHEIETTRKALTDKIEMLETRTQETVENTKTKIKQTFDLSYHVNQRPWAMMGVAVAVGYALQRLNAPAQTRNRSTDDASPYYDTESLHRPYGRERTELPPSAGKAQGGNHTGSAFLDQFHGEFSLLKGAAVGAVASLVRDFIKQALPDLTTTSQPPLNKTSSPHYRYADGSAPAAATYKDSTPHSLRSPGISSNPS